MATVADVTAGPRRLSIGKVYGLPMWECTARKSTTAPPPEQRGRGGVL